ncbi:lumazine-binding protein [Mycobacterium sp. MS1601]|uniref:Rv0361 family membrane protein n=1 Tax=Mycobacterium sp. MS1601 TaxID=1936029 RepID=UPI0009798192|nr:lumazine-binding protein [Mycobacterium sp. MS1601]AQA03817.1 lumazine-binding protein [Mycobacterium sp. MS1601]
MTKTPKEEPENSVGATPWPFMIALAIIVIVIAGIVVVRFVEGDDIPEVDVVAQAAIAQNDALQRADYADFTTYTCAAEVGEESKVLQAQQESVNSNGQRYVDGVSGVTIDGDTATGTVTYHFDNAPDHLVPVETTFAREDGQWKVCTPGQ